MASTKRVTVRASRTRPGLQTRCKAPPWRAKEMDNFTSTEMPELSIWGISLRSTMILRAPLCVSFCTKLLRCSLGSPMVSLPCTITKWIPYASRTVTSKGGCRVIEPILTTCTRNLGRRQAVSSGAAQALYDDSDEVQAERRDAPRVGCNAKARRRDPGHAAQGVDG